MLLPTLRGEPSLNRHLHASLRILAAQSPDQVLRERIADVLAGRSGLRDLARDEAFGRFMAPLVDRGAQEYAECDPETGRRIEAEVEALARDPRHQTVTEVVEPDEPEPNLGTW